MSKLPINEFKLPGVLDKKSVGSSKKIPKNPIPSLKNIEQNVVNPSGKEDIRSQNKIQREFDMDVPAVKS